MRKSKINAIICITAMIALLCGCAKGASSEPTEPESEPINVQYYSEEHEKGEFTEVYYASSINGKLFMAKTDGIYVADPSLENEEQVYSGTVSSKIVTDGYSIYFIDRGSCEVKCLDLNDNSVKEVYTLYDSEEYDGYKEGYIMGCAKEYLYFNEWYDGDEYKTYIYNTSDGSCKTSEEYFGDLKSYGDDIYYVDLRYELTYAPLYKAKTDGSGKKTVAENVGVFTISDNILYYSESVDGKTTVKSENLETGEEETILSMTGIDVFSMTGSMLCYRDEAGAEYVYHYDGEEIENVEGLYGIYENKIICREEGENGSVIFSDITNEKSAVVDEIDYAVTYAAEKIWYINKSGRLSYKELV
jgi:hypothetical protein